VRRAIDADGEGHLDGRRVFVYGGNQIGMDFWRANSEDMQVDNFPVRGRRPSPGREPGVASARCPWRAPGVSPGWVAPR